MQRELSSVYTGISGANRALSSWQGCVGGVNRELLSPPVSYRVSTNQREWFGQWVGAASSGEFSPNIAWNSIYDSIQYTNLYGSVESVTLSGSLMFDASLLGKKITVTANLGYTGSANFSITMLDQSASTDIFQAGPFDVTLYTTDCPVTMSWSYTNLTLIDLIITCNGNPIILT